LDFVGHNVDFVCLVISHEMKFKIVAIILSIWCFTIEQLSAQDGPILFQAFNHISIINPAYSGTNNKLECGIIRGSFYPEIRDYISQTNVTPRIMGINISAPIKIGTPWQSGFDFCAFSNKIGFSHYRNIKVGYSKKLILKDSSVFSVGLQLQRSTNRIAFSKLKYFGSDPLIPKRDLSDGASTVHFGILYFNPTHSNFYAGLSVLNFKREVFYYADSTAAISFSHNSFVSVQSGFTLDMKSWMHNFQLLSAVQIYTPIIDRKIRGSWFRVQELLKWKEVVDFGPVFEYGASTIFKWGLCSGIDVAQAIMPKSRSNLRIGLAYIPGSRTGLLARKYYELSVGYSIRLK
jgi:Type IX secretion system membrane protein PorP/SprF